jgi:hypothetical protein
MVDQITDSDWNRLYDRVQKEGLTTSDSILDDFLIFWNTSRHQIKNGLDKSGKQRFKTVSPRQVTYGTTRLGQELAKPFQVQKSFDSIGVNNYERTYVN